MKKTLLLIVLITGMFSTGWLTAQEETVPVYQDENSIIIQDTPGETAPQEQSGRLLTVWDVVRMILILAAVLLVIYLIFHFMRKAGGPKFRESDLIRMHASLGLGANKSLHLIEVGQEIFLVGASEESVNLISKIETKESLDEIRFRISTEKSEPEGKPFSAVFSRLFQRDKQEINLSRSLAQNRDFLKEQRERLKKM